MGFDQGMFINPAEVKKKEGRNKKSPFGLMGCWVLLKLTHESVVTFQLFWPRRRWIAAPPGKQAPLEAFKATPALLRMSNGSLACRRVVMNAPSSAGCAAVSVLREPKQEGLSESDSP